MEKEVVPLRYSIAASASADIATALLHIDDLVGSGIADTDAAERFEECFDAAISAARERIAREIADTGKPFDSPDEVASYALSQTMYRLAVETTKKRSRRSSAGLWHVFYTLRDMDGDGVIDTLRVHRVRHSAARPLSKTSVRETGD